MVCEVQDWQTKIDNMDNSLTPIPETLSLKANKDQPCYNKVSK